jgi:uncharacterized protein involved in exopolysaccharide biosynthesis
MENHRNKNEISFNLLDFLMLIAKWKTFLFLNTLIISLIAIIYSLIIPKSYVATSTIMPPESQGVGLSSLMAGLPLKGLLGGAGLGESGIENVFLAILQSRKNKLELIEKFDLLTVYKFNESKEYYIEDVFKAIDENIFYDITGYGTIEVGAEDEDPERAAAMANFMVENLNRIYINLKTESAKNQRVFLEERLVLVKSDLKESEDTFCAFQKENNAIALDEQTKAAIDAAANVEAQYLAVDIELNFAKKIYHKDNYKINELKTRLKALQEEKEKINKTKFSKIFIPLNDAPDLGLEFFRLKRNLKMHELIYEFLIQQYEKAKFEEAKETPHVQILDKATPPEKRSKPKRRRLVIIVFLISLFEGVIVIKLIDYFINAKKNNTSEYLAIQNIFKVLLNRKSNV